MTHTRRSLFGILLGGFGAIGMIKRAKLPIAVPQPVRITDNTSGLMFINGTALRSVSLVGDRVDGVQCYVVNTTSQSVSVGCRIMES